jgi:hypothetical protein
VALVFVCFMTAVATGAMGLTALQCWRMVRRTPQVPRTSVAPALPDVHMRRPQARFGCGTCLPSSDSVACLLMQVGYRSIVNGISVSDVLGPATAARARSAPSSGDGATQ